MAAWNDAPAAGGLGECSALVRSAEALRFSAPELAVQLARRALAVGAESAKNAEVDQARELSMRAQAVLAAGLVRMSHYADAVEPAFAALALAESEGKRDVATSVRLDLSVCSREVGEPLLGCALLRPVLDADPPSPSVRAVALGRLVGCIAHVGRRDDIEDALTEADRLLAADDGLSPDLRRMERARLSVRAAAYHRWYGDTEDAADAAREGLTQLNRLRGLRAETSRLRAQLVLELACALLDEGELEEAASVSELVLAEPVRATSAAAAGRLMLAVSTRVHLPSGRVDRGRGLLDQAVWVADRHGLDELLADALTSVSQLDENAARPVEALESLHAARAAEQRRLRATTLAARRLLTEANPAKWNVRTVNALLRKVVRSAPQPQATPDDWRVAAQRVIQPRPPTRPVTTDSAPAKPNAEQSKPTLPSPAPFKPDRPAQPPELDEQQAGWLAEEAATTSINPPARKASAERPAAGADAAPQPAPLDPTWPSEPSTRAETEQPQDVWPMRATQETGAGEPQTAAAKAGDDAAEHPEEQAATASGAPGERSSARLRAVGPVASSAAAESRPEARPLDGGVKWPVALWAVAKTDSSETGAAQEQHVVEVDAATGLLNKDGLIRRLRAVRNGDRPVALTLVRLDGELGTRHFADPGTRPATAAEFELSELAGRVRSIAPEDAELARSDGAELAVLLPRTTRDQAERFAAEIEAAWLRDAGGQGISTGVVQSNPDASSVDARALINAARHALTPAVGASDNTSGPPTPRTVEELAEFDDTGDTLRIGREIIRSLSIPEGSGGKRRAANESAAGEPSAETLPAHEPTPPESAAATPTNTARPGDAPATTRAADTGERGTWPADGPGAASSETSAPRPDTLAEDTFGKRSADAPWNRTAVTPPEGYGKRSADAPGRRADAPSNVSAPEPTFDSSFGKRSADAPGRSADATAPSATSATQGASDSGFGKRPTGTSPQSTSGGRAGGGKSDASTYEETKAELARMISVLMDGKGKQPSVATPLPAPARPAEDHANGTRLSIPTPPEPDDVPEPERRPDIPEPPEPDPIPAPPTPEPGPPQPAEPGPLGPSSATSPVPRHDAEPGRLAPPSATSPVPHHDAASSSTSSRSRQSDDPRSLGSPDAAASGARAARGAGRQRGGTAADAAPRRVGERSGPFAPPSVTKMADVFREHDNDAGKQSNGTSNGASGNGHGLAAAFGGRRQADDAQPEQEPDKRSGSTTIAGLLAEALAAYQENPDDADDPGAAPARQEPDKRDQDFDRLFDWRYQSPASGRHRSPE